MNNKNRKCILTSDEYCRTKTKFPEGELLQRVYECPCFYCERLIVNNIYSQNVKKETMYISACQKCGNLYDKVMTNTFLCQLCLSIHAEMITENFKRTVYSIKYKYVPCSRVNCIKKCSIGLLCSDCNAILIEEQGKSCVSLMIEPLQTNKSYKVYNTYGSGEHYTIYFFPYFNT